MAVWKQLASLVAGSLDQAEEEEACSFMVQAEVHEMENSVNVDSPQGEITENEQLHGGGFSGNNSEQTSKNLDSVSLPTESALKSHHQLESRRGQLNEAKVALIDTACTSCMHSKAWRVAYSRFLPDGHQCVQTERTKVFHFADGSSSSKALSGWEIPIFLGGKLGSVFSAEVESGSTPLLLSIASLAALDAVIFVRDQKIVLRNLDVELPLLYTQTKHLAMHVVSGREAEPRVPNLLESGNRDLIVYLTEEAELGVLELEPLPRFLDDKDERVCKVNTEPRGIRATDARGELDSRRCMELKKAVARVRHQDSRIWSSLQRRYTLAEQAATNGFRNTVIFEPFAGSFVVTKMASRRYGWTSSQPLDRIDGYDLLSGPGRSMVLKTLQQHRPFLVVVAFDCRIWTIMTNMNLNVDWDAERIRIGLPTLRIVVLICKIQHEAGRFYLVENPVGSKAWTFHDILLRLLTDCGGKFVIGDQCAYGARDRETGRPIRKTTGYITNSEAVANAVGRRCTCPHGAHQPVISQNSFGQRSKQAAQYPEGLCRAICDGVMHEMKICYIVQQASGRHFAFPVDDDDDEVIDVDQQQQWLQIARSLAAEDSWEIQEHQLIRHHSTPRQALFIPLSDSEPPVQIPRILPERTTEFIFLDGTRDALEDNWVKDGAKEMDDYWTGRTIFQLASQVAPEPSSGLQDFQPEPMQSMIEVSEELGDGHGRGQGRNAGVLRRRRARTRQLQRGLWTLCEDDEELNTMIENTSEGTSGKWRFWLVHFGYRWCLRWSMVSS